ncbi:hypothetical protein [Nitrosopumilus sp. b2]|uniref:hypothetical protein n=1 Tax=Nitrosopumilus sp. b2 TaxID=2109908 RepID=UPI0015F75BC7|nr:hypothetical protein [Nitrosopumilus sp. b2]KAF6244910.1 hypothetical protein C6989_05895 [Nitrosopumilus sp. b2]
MFEIEERPTHRSALRFDLVLFVLSAVLLVFVFPVDLDEIFQEYPIPVLIMFVPVFAISFFYGVRIAEQVINPSTPRKPFRQKIVTFFLGVFLVASLFSAINFAINSGINIPDDVSLDDGLFVLANNFIQNNGGMTFLIISSISVLAVFTKKMIKIEGSFATFFSFIGTFLFFFMSLLTVTNLEPTSFQIYLYACYQIGIISGIFYVAQKYTAYPKTEKNLQNPFKPSTIH